MYNLDLYQTIFLKRIESKFNSEAHFSDAFGIPQMTDGIEESDTAFTLKHAPALQNLQLVDYNKTADVSKESRYGTPVEIKYLNQQVPYDYTKSAVPFLDKTTLNNNFEKAIGQTMDSLAQSIRRAMNEARAKKLSQRAGITLDLADLTEDSLTDLFTELYETFKNNEVTGEKIAYVTPALKAAIIKHPDADNSKYVDGDLSTMYVWKFYDFIISDVPAQYFVENEAVYATVFDVGVSFVGINELELKDTPNASGKIINFVTKGGNFIPEENKDAVAKVTYTAPAKKTRKAPTK